jgi:hypothetical protein
MKQKHIKDKNGVVLATLISEGSWDEGLSFYTNDENFIQVGTWGYQKGKELKSHKHNRFVRESNITQEVIYIKKGKLLAKLFSEEDNILVEEIILVTGDTLILFFGGHGYTVLEDNTQVLEVKNGPYFGVEKDKTLI